MKVLIVSENRLSNFGLKELPPEIHLFEYWHPLKALDNFDEIQPEAVIWNALDFPRHWKTALQLFLEFPGRTADAFLLITDQNYDQSEKEKADYLGIQHYIPIELWTNAGPDLMKHVLKILEFTPTNRPAAESADDSQLSGQFLWTDPDSGRLVHGASQNIHSIYMRVSSYSNQPINPAYLGKKLEHTTLLLGDQCLHPHCIVSDVNGNNMTVFFTTPLSL